jgi:hypothetical protein
VPPDLVTWLRVHPDVIAGTPRRTRLAGLDFEVLDLTYRFSRPAHDVPRCRLQGFRCTSLGPGDFHPNGAVQRVYVRTTDPGPLVVALEGSDAGAFREVERAARPLLHSLEVTRP